MHRRVSAGTPAAVPGPLRILVAISSPDESGGPLLDYERELRNVLTAVGAARDGSAHVRVVPFATTAQIRAALEVDPVHVLHISGHGSPGSLMLEHDDGREREIDADTFVDEAIPPGRMPAVIALAACYTNVARAADAPSFAARLAERGAAVVIASETSVTDVYATKAFARIYGRLAEAGVPDAVAAVGEARRAVQAELDATTHERDRTIAGLGEWAVLSVLAGAGAVAILDPDVTQRPPPAPRRFGIGRVTARAAGEFVGRRRAQRRWPGELLAAGRAGLVLHGIGGIGKTTLAAELVTRVVERDPARQVTVLEGALDVERVLTAIVATLRKRLILTQRYTGDAATALDTPARRPAVGRPARAAARRADGRRRAAARRARQLRGQPRPPRGRRRYGRAGARGPAERDRCASPPHGGCSSRAATRSRCPTTRPRPDVPSGPGAVGRGDAQARLVAARARPPARRQRGRARLAHDRRPPAFAGVPRRAAVRRRRTLPRHRAPPRGGATRPARHGRADLLKAEWELDSAIAQVATIAADDVLLGDLLGSLSAVPGARELLIGASVYREPVDVNALLFQVGEPDDTAAYKPDRRGAGQQIVGNRQGGGGRGRRPDRRRPAAGRVQAAIAPHVAELGRAPLPPAAPPARLDAQLQRLRRVHTAVA